MDQEVYIIYMLVDFNICDVELEAMIESIEVFSFMKGDFDIIKMDVQFSMVCMSSII